MAFELEHVQSSAHGQEPTTGEQFEHIHNDNMDKIVAEFNKKVNVARDDTNLAINTGTASDSEKWVRIASVGYGANLVCISFQIDQYTGHNFEQLYIKGASDGTHAECFSTIANNSYRIVRTTGIVEIYSIVPSGYPYIFYPRVAFNPFNVKINYYQNQPHVELNDTNSQLVKTFWLDRIMGLQTTAKDLVGAINELDSRINESRRKFFTFNTADFVDATGALPAGYFFKLLEWTPATYISNNGNDFLQYEMLPNFDLFITMKSDNTNGNTRLTNGRFKFWSAEQYEWDYDLRPGVNIGYSFQHRMQHWINDVGGQQVIFESDASQKPNICIMRTEDNKLQLWITSFSVASDNPKNTVFECDIRWYNELEPEVVIASGVGIETPILNDSSDRNAFAPNYDNVRSQIRTNYNEIKNVRNSIPQPMIVDITDMVTTNVPVKHLSVTMTITKGTRPNTIEVTAQDTSGNSNDLILEFAKGVGAMESEPLMVLNSDAAGNPTFWKIDFVPETATQQCKITIPNGCKYATFKFFQGEGENPSYYVNTNQEMHRFDLANTPLNGLSGHGMNGYINGVSVNKYNITTLVFGDSYKSVTSINFTHFLYAYESVKVLKLDGLSSVVSINNDNFIGLPQVEVLDLSMMTILSMGNNNFNSFSTAKTLKLPNTSVNSVIGNGNFSGFTEIIELDLRPLNNATIGGYGFNLLASLERIITSNDGSNIAANYTFQSINGTGTIYATTTVMAETFRSRFTPLANWSVDLISNLPK